MLTNNKINKISMLLTYLTKQGDSNCKLEISCSLL